MKADTGRRFGPLIQTPDKALLLRSPDMNR